MVQAVIDDWRTAPVSEKLRATLGLLEKVTCDPSLVTSSDMVLLLVQGISKCAIEDALLICACFNLISRIADAFDVAIPSAEGFAYTAEHLLGHGYL